MGLSLIITRLLQAIVVLVGVSMLTFALVRVIPGDPVALMLGDQATPQQISQARAAYGLNKPIWVQYLYYARDLLHGNFGESLRQQQPVGQLVWQSFPATAQLAVVSIVFSILVGVPIGIYSAAHRGS